MKAKLNRRDNDYWLHNESGETIASSWGVPSKKLSKENCDEIFGIVNVEKLAEEEYKSHASNEDLYGNSEDLQLAYKAGVVDGFNKALKLNKDKVFTEEDIRRAMSAGLSIGYGRQFEIENKSVEIDNYIQSLQQPTEIDVEIEMKKVVDETKVIGAVKGVKGSGDKITTYKTVPKLDSEGCLILKRIV